MNRLKTGFGISIWVKILISFFIQYIKSIFMAITNMKERELWTQQRRRMMFRIGLAALKVVWNSVYKVQVHTLGHQTPNIFLQTVPDQYGMENHLSRQQSTMSDNTFYNSKKDKQCAKRSFSCRDRNVWVPLYMKDISSDLKLAV